MKELTERQRQVLAFITEYIKAHNYPPTTREIAGNFAISVKGAYDHVTVLVKKGYLKSSNNRSRTLELVKDISKTESEPFVNVPILGTVAAGLPILTEENWDGTFPVHSSMLKQNGTYFVLKVRGDSMIQAGIIEGDFALIEKRDTAQNGDIIVAQVDEDAITLKRYFKESSRIRLQPENPHYQAKYYKDNIRVVGRLAYIFRSCS
jgi:repressor LexA